LKVEMLSGVGEDPMVVEQALPAIRGIEVGQIWVSAGFEKEDFAGIGFDTVGLFRLRQGQD
jgi:hypothetical protein